MKLTSKIRVGFLVVLGLHIAVAAMAHVGQERAQRDLSRVEDGNRLTRSMLEVDRLVGVLRGAVQGYTFSGNQGLAVRGERTYEELVHRLEEVERMLSEERAAEVAAMAASLASYAANFRAAVEDRTRREQLVQEDLPALARRSDGLQADLQAQLRAEAGGDDPAGRSRALREAARLLLVAQNGAHQYLVQLDSEAMRRANAAIASLRDQLRAYPDLLLAFDPVASEYERVLLGLVQSTRGYLHLVHVVMAAEAVEFLRASAELREAAKQRVELLQAGIRRQQEDYRMWSNVVSVVTIVLGLLAGAVLGRLVVGPLQAITATLRRLRRGEPAEIPGLDRRDEIGDMASAAQQLRERSAEAERLTREQERMIEDLERSNRDLDDFTRIASHDLKAPLRAIATIARWIEEDCGEQLPELARGHLERLNQRVVRTSRLLSDLKSYSKLTRGDEAHERVDVCELLRDLSRMSGEVAFPCELRAPDQVMITTVPVALTQVVGNLLANSVRHHDRPEGNVVLEVVQEPGAVTITVTDDGPGIPPEHHERVFAPFQTLHPREDQENSGLGLAIVRSLVDRNGGELSLESPVQNGRGARFVVRWPDAAASAPAPAEPVCVAT
ncbi:MAG: sensor histidine kinase [Planctomycetota bacterium]